MHLLALGLVALLCAGCTVPAGPLTAPASDAWPRFAASLPVSRDLPGAEPVVAVANDGTVYVEGIGTTLLDGQRTNVNKAWRSDDGGAHWLDITPPLLGQERSNDGFLALQGSTVFVSNVFSLTLDLYRSEDKGQDWTPVPVPHIPLLMHRHWLVPVGSALHLVVEALPPAFLPFLAGQPPPVPATGTPNEGLWYLRSNDGGLTWEAPVQIDPNVNFAGQGNLVASADGQKLYVLRYADADGALTPSYQQGQWYVLASEDGGSTWQRRDAFPLTTELASAVEPLALLRDGTLAMAWSQLVANHSLLHLATSADGGRHWSKPMLLGQGAVTQAQPWLAAHADRVGLVWYQADVPGPAAKVNASWSGWYADITGLGGALPQLHATRVAPDVHHGNICARGPACGPGEDRRLLDYPWLAFGLDGTAHAVWASTEWEKPSAFTVFAREAR
ncbi:MAG: glycoside hydrolase [Halobacteriales archaeon]|nr:glycoside hydrolase [Halobacteriales archaeon]